MARALRRRSRSRCPARRSAGSGRRPAARPGQARRSRSRCSSSGCGAGQQRTSASGWWVWAKTIRSVSSSQPRLATTWAKASSACSEGSLRRDHRGRRVGRARPGRPRRRLLAALARGLVADDRVEVRLARQGAPSIRRRCRGRAAQRRAASPRSGKPMVEADRCRAAGRRGRRSAGRACRAASGRRCRATR